jgi:Primase C terminal 2 (PriCT-2)/Bifunctional DNA primase/polymerase, N-terminal
VASAIEFARHYLHHGWRLVAVPPGGKAPLDRGWPQRIIAEPDLPRLFGHGENIGIILGAPSGHLVDVDLDCPEAVLLADRYLPPTSAVFGRASKPQSHRFYIAEGCRYVSFADPLDGSTLLELRCGNAHQTIVPPSIAGGERRRWDSRIDPLKIAGGALRLSATSLAIACLVARHVDAGVASLPDGELPRLLAAADPRLSATVERWLGKKKEKPWGAERWQSPRQPSSLADIVAHIPNSGFDWHHWNVIGMAIYASSGGSGEGYQVFHEFSSRSPKYQPHAVAERWRNYHRHPPNRLSLGTLLYLAGNR